jgi:hypothetical protein
VFEAAPMEVEVALEHREPLRDVADPRLELSDR